MMSSGFCLVGGYPLGVAVAQRNWDATRRRLGPSCAASPASGGCPEELGCDTSETWAGCAVSPASGCPEENATRPGLEQSAQQARAAANRAYREFAESRRVSVTCSTAEAAIRRAVDNGVRGTGAAPSSGCSWICRYQRRWGWRCGERGQSPPVPWRAR